MSKIKEYAESLVDEDYNLSEDFDDDIDYEDDSVVLSILGLTDVGDDFDS